MDDDTEGIYPLWFGAQRTIRVKQAGSKHVEPFALTLLDAGSSPATSTISKLDDTPQFPLVFICYNWLIDFHPSHVKFNQEVMMEIHEIMEILPHRYPFLLVDRIVELNDTRIVGIKNVTINEPFFIGHFPGNPIMPGVLIVESMAQTGGILLLKKVDNPKGKLVYFLAIKEAKFRAPVRPGDTLRNEMVLKKFTRGVCVMEGKAYVGDKLVAEGEFMAKVVEVNDG